MPKHTLEERLIAGLKAAGWVLCQFPRSGYAEFVHPDRKQTQKMFVGKSGALRAGECASRSYSIGCPAHQSVRYLEILAAGDKALDPMSNYKF